MLKKSNSLRADISACDCCSAKATVFTSDGRAYCLDHASVKKASEDKGSLKSAGASLTDMHRKG